MRFFIFILFLFLLQACQKKEIDVSFKEIAGDYEWFYSENGAAFDVSDDQFGIRITKNGRLKFFKNGELVESYRIYKTFELNSRVSVHANNEDDPVTCGVLSDTLSTWGYPMASTSNYYVKIK